MYNVVDTFYGGLISSQALAALSLSFPIYFIIIAVGFGVAQGTTALIGNALGRGDQDEAQRYSVQGLWYGVLVSIVLTIGVIAAAPARDRRGAHRGRTNVGWAASCRGWSCVDPATGC